MSIDDAVKKDLDMELQGLAGAEGSPAHNELGVNFLIFPHSSVGFPKAPDGLIGAGI